MIRHIGLWGLLMALSLLLASFFCQPAWAQAGNLDLILTGEGGFSGSDNPSNNGFYTTGLNGYAFTGNLGYWFDDTWEAGFGAGPGRVDYQSCNAKEVCSSASSYSLQARIFGRYNFNSGFGGETSFAGVQIVYVHARAALGNAILIRPVAGYRFSLINDWSLEVSVGAGVPVAGDTTRFSTNYDVQMGLSIPLRSFQ